MIKSDCNKIEFKKLTVDDVVNAKEYFKACALRLSEYSMAFKVMWQEYFTEYFAYIENCLVFKEFFQGKTYFHYPLSLCDKDAEDRALDALEQYCKSNDIRMHFTAVPAEKLCRLVERYGSDLTIKNRRRWRDYLYNAGDFVTFAGRKFSGQRNHINKFRKLYPDYEYCVLTSCDGKEIKAFLKEYEEHQLAKGTVTAKEELVSVYKLVDIIDKLGLIAGGLKVEGRLIAFSVGERCGDQLIIHVEKALVKYQGAYATIANEFAGHNVADGIRFINREDDAGDPGLRKSKLQYNPVRLIDKYIVSPRRAIDSVSQLPVIKTERTELREIKDIDAVDLFRLEYSAKRNRYWGYDWRKHFKSEPTPEFFLKGKREDFHNKAEMPLGIFVDGKFSGEVVLHNFGYNGECEIGVRLLPEYEGKGIAKEAVEAYAAYALFEMDIDCVMAKCYKQNMRSRRMLLSAGLKECGEDETFFYFRKTAVM